MKRVNPEVRIRVALANAAFYRASLHNSRGRDIIAAHKLRQMLMALAQ